MLYNINSNNYISVLDVLSLNLLQGSLVKIIDYKIVYLHVFVCLVC
jgi:hypothetical protein